MWESENAKSVDLGHWTASHCDRFVQGINFKMTQISICTYLQRWGGTKMWCRETIQEQEEDCKKKKVPLLLLKRPALFFFLSSKCSSPLFVSFLLIVALAVAFGGAWTLHATEGLRKCESRFACVACIAADCIICNAAKCCALLFYGS